MKHINFIHPVPPHRDKEVKRWILISGSILSMTLIGLFIRTTFYLYEISTITIPQNIENEFQETVRACKDKEHHYETQQHTYEALYRYQHTPKTPFKTLQSIVTLIGASHIKALAHTKQHCEITATISDIARLQSLIAKLESLPIVKSVQLISVKKDQKNFIATLRLLYKQKKSPFKTGS